jgi:CheY-like chemotaxis protein
MAGGATVLMIDDDADFRESVRAVLEGEGYDVIEAESGKEGLRKLAEHKPGLIILDVMMECCMEGYGVNQAIKYQDTYAPFRDIPILMVSSIEQSPDERFPMAGELDMVRPDLYMTKPLDIPRFLDIVRRYARSS